MASPCACITQINEQLMAYNTELVHAWEVDRKTSAVLTTVKISTVVLQKKRGARPVGMLPMFCPFCGQRYQSEEARP